MKQEKTVKAHFLKYTCLVLLATAMLLLCACKTSDQNDHTHTWGDWQTTEATCAANGEKIRTCTSCGEQERETIPALEHTEVTVPGKAATCIETGLTDGKKCSVCGTVTMEQQTVATTAHTEIIVPGKAATCIETGLTYGKKCSVCGTVTVEQQTIATTSHTEVTVPGKAATCIETGLTDGKKCSVCGVVTVEHQTIPMASHTEVTAPGKAATCTETGLTDGKKCSVCGIVTVAHQTIPMTAHTEVTVAGKAATCTENGRTEGKRCSVCGETTVVPKTISAKGHHYVNGTCRDCGAKEGSVSQFSEGLEFILIPGTNSYYVIGIGSCTDTDVVIPSTYNGLPVTGIRDFAFSECTGLKSVVIPDSVTIICPEAFSRCTSLTGIMIPDSVTSIGMNTFYGCSSLTNVTIPESVTYIGGYVFADCSNLTSVVIPGSVAGIGNGMFLNCSSLTSVVIPEGVTSIGEYAFWGCSSLTHVTIPGSVTSIGEDAFSEGTEIVRPGDAEHTHTWGDWQTTAATCTQPGEKVRTCTSCGDQEKQRIPATGHTYVDGICKDCGVQDDGSKLDELNGQTPEQLYTAAMEQMKTLENCTLTNEMITDAFYQGMSGQMSREVMSIQYYAEDNMHISQTSYSDGRVNIQEIWYVDGIFYANQNGQRIKIQISLEDMKEIAFGSPDQEGYFIELSPSMFEGIRFEKDEETGTYTLTFQLDGKEFLEKVSPGITEQAEFGNFAYVVHFDETGTLKYIEMECPFIWSEREFLVHGVTVVSDVDTTSRVSAPADADAYLWGQLK